MFLKLSSNIVGKLSPNIAICRLVGTELNTYSNFFFNDYDVTTLKIIHLIKF